jgi:hypothetical protein
LCAWSWLNGARGSFVEGLGGEKGGNVEKNKFSLKVTSQTAIPQIGCSTSLLAVICKAFLAILKTSSL